MATELDSDEAAFLSAIIAVPEDDAARLAYADWLDEHGHPARARYIRWRILGFSALGIWGATSDLIIELGRLEEESLAAFCEWAGPELAPYFRDKSHYNRGLLRTVAVGARRDGPPCFPYAIEHCERLFQLAPIREVQVWGGTAEQIRQLLFRSEMARIETLVLQYGCWLEDVERLVDALIESPHLGGLRRLLVHAKSVADLWEGDAPRDGLSPTQRARLAERFGAVLVA